jgi:hypothetical protein
MKSINTSAFLQNSVPELISIIKKIGALIGIEAFIWTCGLFYLIFINSPEAYHFTICPISNLGFDFCPGCGLGNSISFLFQGNLEASFQSHPFGIFAFVIIVTRIISLIKNNWRRQCQMSYN